ncbi:MAG: hypothetical protein V3T21_03505 [Candidatus Margulisiibacteriota bacterium]
MSIANAIATFTSASLAASQSDKVVIYKAVLSKKTDEIHEKAKKLVEDRFSDIVQRAAQPEVNINQLRYEVITLKTDLVNLFRGKELAQDYKFQIKSSVDVDIFNKKIEKLKILLFKILDLKFKKFEGNIKNCESIPDIKKSINDMKEFISRFKKIMKKQRVLPMEFQKPALKQAKAQPAQSEYSERYSRRPRLDPKVATIDLPSTSEKRGEASAKPEGKAALFKVKQKSKQTSLVFLDPDKMYHHPDGTEYMPKELAAARTSEQKQKIIADTEQYRVIENTRKRKILGKAAEKIENYALKKLKEMGIHGNGVIVLKANILQRTRKSLEFINQKKDGSLSRPKHLGRVYFKYKGLEGKGNMEINAKAIKLKKDFEEKLNELPLLSIGKKLLSLTDEALGSLFFETVKDVNGKPVYINGKPKYMIWPSPAFYLIKIKVSGEELEIIHE